MRFVDIAVIVLLELPAGMLAQTGRSTQPAKAKETRPVLSNEDLGAVSPALEKYTRGTLADLWKRPDLSPRDRSLVTVSALIARNQTHDLSHYINVALDSGVKPGEISEIITQLAFYSGLSNASAAASITKGVFGKRGVKPDHLPPAQPELLPVDEAEEAQRAAGVQKNFGAVAPGVVQYTTDVLFRDLWVRPGLTPRDRGLVTFTALISMGQSGIASYVLNRAMNNGLTQAQASEALTHLAFYAGWPNVFAALPVVRTVFEGRPK